MICRPDLCVATHTDSVLFTELDTHTHQLRRARARLPSPARKRCHPHGRSIAIDPGKRSKAAEQCIEHESLRLKIDRDDRGLQIERSKLARAAAPSICLRIVFSERHASRSSITRAAISAPTYACSSERIDAHRGGTAQVMSTGVHSRFCSGDARGYARLHARTMQCGCTSSSRARTRNKAASEFCPDLCVPSAMISAHVR